MNFQPMIIVQVGVERLQISVLLSTNFATKKSVIIVRSRTCFCKVHQDQGYLGPKWTLMLAQKRFVAKSAGCDGRL